ncbi:sodium-dependent transporter [Hyphococcus luteus]|uniref:Transporter n=1 Tax=Hyphococcus luteus TaxID=2058213 RepID=A0A2S7K4A6_9PROT|nr:sodium-dependent transporter [Marinicaulis flavus]PQA87344.1 sodium-dependent transporter [Marinicaulis flavus]
MQGTAGEGAHWSSRAAFIMAAIGSSVGLGNLWRFPYVAGENGGGAFVVFYIICVALIGLPVLVAELFIGRRGGMSVVGSVVKIAKAEGRSPLWALQSWTGMLGAFIILTFYSVIAGWVLAYVVMIGGGLVTSIGAHGLAGIIAPAFESLTAEQVSAKLGELLNDPVRMIIYHALFMTLTVFIVMRGIKGGIETAVTYLMPAFFVLLIVLLIYALATGDSSQGLNFLLGVRLYDTELADGAVRRGLLHGLQDGSVISAALGQAFFSIGLGSALMITYGAYMREDQKLPRSARLVAIADTGVGIVAGLAIFPIVFAMGLAPGGGPTLMFQTLPLAFHGMPVGGLFGLAFFLLAFFAAITSSIALLETSTKWVDEQSKADNRILSAGGLGLAAFAIGVLNALSQVPKTGLNGEDQSTFWNTWQPLGEMKLFKGMVLLDFLSATTDLILPIAGFITAVFAGWIVSTSTAREAIGFQSEVWFKRWRFLIRWVCPVGIFLVIAYSTVWAPYVAPMLVNAAQ